MGSGLVRESVTRAGYTEFFAAAAEGDFSFAAAQRAQGELGAIGVGGAFTTIRDSEDRDTFLSGAAFVIAALAELVADADTALAQDVALAILAGESGGAIGVGAALGACVGGGAAFLAGGTGPATAFGGAGAAFAGFGAAAIAVCTAALTGFGGGAAFFTRGAGRLAGALGSAGAAFAFFVGAAVAVCATFLTGLCAEAAHKSSLTDGLAGGVQAGIAGGLADFATGAVVVDLASHAIAGLLVTAGLIAATVGVLGASTDLA